jgi:lipoprotein signal peptidase
LNVSRLSVLLYFVFVVVVVVVVVFSHQCVVDLIKTRNEIVMEIDKYLNLRVTSNEKA